MLNIDEIQNGIVIDHIKAGTAVGLMDLLGIKDNRTASVALIQNARSHKAEGGRKDIIKVEGDASWLNLDVLAYTDGLMCVENTFEKGAVGALHHHPHTQITYVVSGAFEFTVDGVTRTVHKGDTILKEDGVEHGCVCTEAGILLDIFTPMREDFV